MCSSKENGFIFLQSPNATQTYMLRQMANTKIVKYLQIRGNDLVPCPSEGPFKEMSPSSHFLSLFSVHQSSHVFYFLFGAIRSLSLENN